MKRYNKNIKKLYKVKSNFFYQSITYYKSIERILPPLLTFSMYVGLIPIRTFYVICYSLLQTYSHLILYN